VYASLATSLLAAGLAAGLSGCAPKADAPGRPNRTYTNPVFAGSMPDPSVLKHGNEYFAFGTTGNHPRPDGRIYTVLRSTNLVDWEDLGGALAPPVPNSAYHYWAPEAVEHGGKFYLYYCMGRPEQERFELRVATAEFPEGPYRDCGVTLVDCQTNRFTIDPFPFRDDDGQWYLFYACNFPFTTGDQHPGTGIMVDRLVDMTRLAGDCRVVVRARYDWTLTRPIAPCPCTTAPSTGIPSRGPASSNTRGATTVFTAVRTGRNPPTAWTTWSRSIPWVRIATRATGRACCTASPARCAARATTPS
jgi:hypothetical protein